MKGAARAVAYMHDRKESIQDLNFLVKENQVKIDFGLVESFDTMTLKRTNMPPSAFEKGFKAKPSVDIYTLGSMLYKTIFHREIFAFVAKSSRDRKKKIKMIYDQSLLKHHLRISSGNNGQSLDMDVSNSLTWDLLPLPLAWTEKKDPEGRMFYYKKEHLRRIEGEPEAPHDGGIGKPYSATYKRPCDSPKWPREFQRKDVAKKAIEDLIFACLIKDDKDRISKVCSLATSHTTKKSHKKYDATKAGVAATAFADVIDFAVKNLK